MYYCIYFVICFDRRQDFWSDELGNLQTSNFFASTVMLEGGANIVSYDLMKQAINTGHIENMKIIQSIQQMTENSTKAKSSPKEVQDELWKTVYRY